MRGGDDLLPEVIRSQKHIIQTWDAHRMSTTIHVQHPDAIMSGIGPALPPHLLAKRKRQQAEEDSNESSTTPGAKPSKSPDGEEKRRKVIGPAMPLAPLIERPMKPALLEESASDDDDGFGPALPPDCTDTASRTRQHCYTFPANGSYHRTTIIQVTEESSLPPTP